MIKRDKQGIIILTFLILTINICSSIKISPTQQELLLEQYEKKCMTIWVLPKQDYKVRSVWSKTISGNLKDYQLSEKDLDLEIIYEYVEDRYDFCFIANKPENISGIIYFYSESDLIEIGSWIILRASNDPVKKTTINAGNVISTISRESWDETDKLLTITLLLLSCFLGIVIFWNKILYYLESLRLMRNH